MNAKSVPMLVISPTMLSGRNAANNDVKTKNSMFDLYGVRKRGCTSAKTGRDEPVVAHRVEDARLSEQHHEDDR